MRTLIAVTLIAVGLMLVTFSRVVADTLFVPKKPDGRQSPLTVFLGFGDSYLARLYRWFTMVIVGLVFIGVGIAAAAGAVKV